MTRKQRKDLQDLACRIQDYAGSIWHLAYKAKGKAEAEALVDLGEVLISLHFDVNDIRILMDEIYDKPLAGV